MTTTGAATWRDLPRVLRDAARLIWKHWPALLTLALLGAGLRNAVLWLAVWVSDHNSLLAQVILTLAPLGYLLPVIAMLHICGNSMPNISALKALDAPEAATEKRPRRLVDMTVSMLVPFLAVYVSYGLLTQDRERFVNQAAYEEFQSIDFYGHHQVDFAARLGIYTWWVIVAIVAVSWVLRWALGRFENATQFAALAFVGALIEVNYTGQVARWGEWTEGQVRGWAGSRRAAHTLVSGYDEVAARLGWLMHPVETFNGWVGSLIGSLDQVVIVPIAWLTVAAVVLGHKLAPAPAPQKPESENPRRLPKAVTDAATSLGADIKERWSAFFSGVKMLAGAGLLPMLAFCLVFLLVLRIPTLVALAARQLIGPVETNTFLAFSPIEGAFGLALSMALVAPLLTAALDWLVAPKLVEADVTSR